MVTNTSQMTQPANKTQQSPASSFNYSQEDIANLLERKNLEDVATLKPTLSYLVVLMVAGVVGNTIVFLVYYRRFKPSVIRTFILAMSVCDFLINVFAIPMQVLEIRFSVTFYSSLGCQISRFFIIFLAMLSACILVAVSVFRQQTICRITPSPQHSVRKVYRAIFICAALSFVVAVPFAVLNGNQTVPIPEANITGVKCSISDEYLGSTFYLVYNVILFVSYVTCVIVMGVSYGKIIYHLRRHKLVSMFTKSSETSDNLEPISTISFTEDNNYTINSANGTDRAHDRRHCTKPPWSRKPDEPSVVLLHSKRSKEKPGELESSGVENVMLDFTNRSSSPSCNTETRDHHQHAEVCTSSKTEELTALKASGKPTQTPHHQRDTVDGDREYSKERRASATSQTSKQSGSKIAPRRSINLGTEVSEIPSRTTLMMFVLTVLFVVNFLPYLVMEVVDQINTEPVEKDIKNNLRYICLRSYYINSAINPLVYSFCSSRFRHECFQLFHCKK